MKLDNHGSAAARCPGSERPWKPNQQLQTADPQHSRLQAPSRPRTRKTSSCKLPSRVYDVGVLRLSPNPHFIVALGLETYGTSSQSRKCSCSSSPQGPTHTHLKGCTQTLNHKEEPITANPPPGPSHPPTRHQPSTSQRNKSPQPHAANHQVGQSNNRFGVNRSQRNHVNRSVRRQVSQSATHSLGRWLASASWSSRPRCRCLVPEALNPA